MSDDAIGLYRTPAGLVPATERDAEKLEGVNFGDFVTARIHKARNGAHHRKAFALLHKLYQNLPEEFEFRNFERFYDWIKVRAGLVDLVEFSENGAVYKLRSLSYANMGQEEFDEVYQALVTVGFEDLGQEWVLAEFS